MFLLRHDPRWLSGLSLCLRLCLTGCYIRQLYATHGNSAMQNPRPGICTLTWGFIESRHPDLKSLGLSRAGSTPAPGTTISTSGFILRGMGETDNQIATVAEIVAAACFPRAFSLLNH
jgi:hypothetical protein